MVALAAEQVRCPAAGLRRDVLDHKDVLSYLLLQGTHIYFNYDGVCCFMPFVFVESYAAHGSRQWLDKGCSSGASMVCEVPRPRALMTVRLPYRRVTFGAHFYSSYGSLARGTPLFLCGLKLCCCFRVAMSIRNMMVSCCGGKQSPKGFLSVRCGATRASMIVW